MMEEFERIISKTEIDAIIKNTKIDAEWTKSDWLKRNWLRSKITSVYTDRLAKMMSEGMRGLSKHLDDELGKDSYAD